MEAPKPRKNRAINLAKKQDVEDIEAEQFLFFADPQDIKEDPQDLQSEDFTAGDSLEWKENEKTIVIDFAKEVNVSGTEHGIMLLNDAAIDDETEILAVFEGIFLDYLTFEAGDITVDDEKGDILKVVFSEQMVESKTELDGLNANSYFRILDMGPLVQQYGEDDEDDWGGQAFEKDFAIAEDLKTAILTPAADKLEAGKDYLFQVRREEIRALNSAVIATGESTTEISTPEAAEVAPEIAEVEAPSSNTIDLTFERSILIEDDEADLEIEDETVGTKSWEIITEDNKSVRVILDDSANEFSGFEAEESYQIVLLADTLSDYTYRNALNSEQTFTLVTESDAAPKFIEAEFVFSHDIDAGETAEERAEVDLHITFDRILAADNDQPDHEIEAGDIELVDAVADSNHGISGTENIVLAEEDQAVLIIEDVESPEAFDFELTAAREYELKIAADSVFAEKFEDRRHSALEARDYGNAEIEGEQVYGLDNVGPEINEVILDEDGSLVIVFDKALSSENFKEEEIKIFSYAADPGESPYADDSPKLRSDPYISAELNQETVTITPAYDFVAFFTGNIGDEKVLEIAGEAVTGADNLVYPDIVEFYSDSEDLGDNFPPVFMGGEADSQENKITLTFSELLDINEVPAGEQFTVEVYDDNDTEGPEVLELAEDDPVEIEGKDVILNTADNGFAAEDEIRVSYSQSDDNIQDLAGNLAAEMYEVMITEEN